MEEERVGEKKKMLEDSPRRTFMYSVYGLLVLVIVVIDMDWNKRHVDCQYNIPSSVTYMTGVLFNKILMSIVMIRSCVF